METQPNRQSESQTPPKPKKFLDQVRDVLRLKHYSFSTEQTYVDWIKRFIFFHKCRHPMVMGALEIKEFLTDLAVNKNVSASTQNQALNTLVFLYKQVLEKNFGELKDIPRAQRPKRVPTVMTPNEVKKVIHALSGTSHLMISLIYGTGLRLMELLRLRVKDLDFQTNQITIREGHKHVSTTMIYTHVLNTPGLGVKSPLDWIN